jgi:NTP pyrophosphatase (non-canonical NTP hydrolase)
MASKTFKQYQKEIDDWAQNLEKPYWSPMSQLARIVEEVGELARVYNHRDGDKVKKPTEEPDDMEGEIGDILFVMMCMANSENIDLDRALQKAIKKVHTRDKDRFAKKPSLKK